MESPYQITNLNEDQSDALNYLGNTTDNVFVTGGAGTGKSFLVKTWLESIYSGHANKNISVAVLASTGVASVLIDGQTFHSFFGIGLAQEHDHLVVQKAADNPNVRENIYGVDVIVIDEISMLNGRVFDIASEICKKVCNCNAPFGGIRIVLCGDFFQLPPVPEFGEKKRDWCFNSHTWKELNIRMLLLEEFMRSTNTEYQYILSKVRVGIIDHDVINFIKSKQDKTYLDTDDLTRLMGRNAEVDSLNHSKLFDLKNPIESSFTEYSGDTKILNSFKRSVPVPEVLDVCVGAKVMVRSNRISPMCVNGTIGRVESIDKYGYGVMSLITVSIKEEVVRIPKITWEYKNKNGVKIASATNFPLSLAWATTIHKSQGASIPELSINLSNLWEPGQAYVALSRASNPDMLYIESWNKGSFRIDREVYDFYMENM